MKAQTLNQIMQGQVKRCRRPAMRRLARILRVSVPFLRGDPNALPPGLDAAVFGLFVDGNGEGIKPMANLVNPPHEAKTRAVWEGAALLADLDRVFFRIPLPDAQTDAQKKRVYRRSLPGQNRIFGAQLIFCLGLLQSIIAGSEELPELSPEAEDTFAADVARVIEALLAPWTTGGLSTPPKGTRILSALASVASGVTGAALKGETPILDKAAETLEELATMLNLHHYGNPHGSLVGPAPAPSDAQLQP